MARLFDDAQNEYLQINSAVLTAVPLTMACWAYVDDMTPVPLLMCLTDKDVDTQGFVLHVIDDGGTNEVWGRTVGAAWKTAETTAGFALNTWFHAAFVTATSASRAVYLNGANKGTNSAVMTPVGVDSTTVGRLTRASHASYMSGRIAWPAIWNVALSDDEVAALAAGAHPTMIRPGSLAAFWPLGGLDTEETDGGTARDIWGGYDLTANSDAVGPGIADHLGGLIYPASPQMVVSTAAVGVAPTSHLYGPLVGPLGGAV